MTSSIMIVLIHAKNLDLTPSIKSFIETKIGSLSRFLAGAEKLAEVRVEISKPSKHHLSGFIYSAEINLKIGGRLLRAVAEHADIRTAVDFAKDELEVQIKKFKQKVRDTSRQPKR